MTVEQSAAMLEIGTINNSAKIDRVRIDRSLVKLEFISIYGGELTPAMKEWERAAKLELQINTIAKIGTISIESVSNDCG